MLLRLSLDDAARLGVRDVEFDAGRLSFGEQEDLQQVGILTTDDLDEWSAVIKGVPKVDRDGAPVLDADGNPARTMTGPAWRAVIWLALRRVGALPATVESWASMRDVNGAAVDVVVEAPPAPKDPDPASTPPATSD